MSVRLFAPLRKNPVSASHVRALLLATVALGPCQAWADDAVVDEIVVTARQREEKAQSVPLAITTITGAQLDATNSFTLYQAQRLAPSLQIQSIQPRNTSFTIRGLGTNAGITNDGMEQGVGLYIDGVYYARPAATIFDLTDVERIEVLRGPQGTLFGKNTTAGALNVATKAPSFTPHLEGEVSVGDYDFTQFKGSVTGALTDKVAGRLSFSSTSRDGTVKNVRYNDDWYDYDNKSIRAQLLFTPADELRVRVIADYSRQTSNAGFYIPLTVLPTQRNDGSTVKSFFQRVAELGYTPLPVDISKRQTDIDTATYFTTKAAGLSLQADWTLPDGHTLTSISAFRYWSWNPSIDGDNLGVNVSTGTNLPTRHRQFSQELRVASPSDQRFEYTAGLFYFWQDARDDYYGSYGSDASVWNLGTGIPSSVLNGVVSHQYMKPETSSYSAFGQGTFHVTERFNLIGGVRYTYEDKKGFFSTNPTGNYLPITAYAPSLQATYQSYRNRYVATNAYSASTSGGNFSGTAGVSYQVTDDVLAYATYSHGFKSAGINLSNLPAGISPIVQPEEVDSYELGLKTTLFNRRLTLNSALFWSDISDYQATYSDPVRPGTSYLTNAAKARSRGFEVDARAALFDGLTATVAFTYDDAYYVSYANAPCDFLNSYKSTCDLSGRPLSGVSRLAGVVAAEYARPVGSQLEAYGGADYRVQSSYYSALTDDTFSRVPSYGTLGLHAGVRSNNWDASIWVKNALDKSYYTVVTVDSSQGLAKAVPGDPRYVGATLRLKY